MYSQKKQAAPAKAKLTYDEKLYGAMEWRSIGPYRGGRAATVTGVPGKPTLFYFGVSKKSLVVGVNILKKKITNWNYPLYSLKKIP